MTFLLLRIHFLLEIATFADNKQFFCVMCNLKPVYITSSCEMGSSLGPWSWFSVFHVCTKKTNSDSFSLYAENSTTMSPSTGAGGNDKEGSKRKQCCNVDPRFRVNESIISGLEVFPPSSKSDNTNTRGTLLSSCFPYRFNLHGFRGRNACVIRILGLAVGIWYVSL